MLRVAAKTLRARKAPFVGAFVALLCGTALVAASGILVESGLRSSVEPQRYAAASAVVGGDQAMRPEGGDVMTTTRLPEPVLLPERMVGDLAEEPAVELTVGDHTAEVAVQGADGDAEPVAATGHGWDTAPLGPYTLRNGDAPASDSEVVLDADLAGKLGASPGDTLTLTSTATPTEYEVSGVASHEDRSSPRRNAVFFTPAQAEQLSGAPDRVTAIGVVAAEDTGPDELTAALESAAGDRDVTVHTGQGMSRLEFSDVGQSRGLLLLVASSFGGLAVLIALFIVSATLSLSVHQRRREFAVLRAIGATPGQILRIVGAEALLVAAAAAVVGCVPGVLVAQGLRAFFARIGAIPADLHLSVGPLPLLAAVAVTVLTALMGGVTAAVRPARVDPVGALRQSAAESGEPAAWRRTAGLVCLALGVSASLTPLALRTELGAAGTGSAVLLLVVAVALLGPVLLPPLVGAVTAPLRRIRVSGFLAAEHTESDYRRLGSVLTPLVLAIGLTLSMSYTQSVLTSATDTQVREGLAADAVLTEAASGGIGAKAVADIAETPGVGAVSPVRETELFVTRSLFGDPEVVTYTASGVAPQALNETLDLGGVDGDLSRMGEATMAMENSNANLLGAEVGDELDVRLGDGTPATLRLVATYERGLGFGDVVVPNGMLEGHAAPPSRLLLASADGAGTQRLHSAAEEAAQRYPTLEVTDRSGFVDRARAQSQLAAWINLAGLAVILGYIAVAVVNTLVMATAGRFREFALLRLIGTTRHQLTRSLWWEVLVLVLLAVILGTVAALVPLSVLSVAFLGTPVPVGPPGVYAGVVGGTALLTALAVMVPVRLSLRSRPVDALGVRE